MPAGGDEQASAVLRGQAPPCLVHGKRQTERAGSTEGERDEGGHDERHRDILAYAGRGALGREFRI